MGSRDSVVGVVTRLRAGRSKEVQVRVPAAARDICVLQNVQAVSASYPASCSINIWKCTSVPPLRHPPYTFIAYVEKVFFFFNFTFQ